MGELRASTSGELAIAGSDFVREFLGGDFFFGGDFFDMNLGTVSGKFVRE